MKREDVVNLVAEELEACGVKSTHYAIRKVPSSVQVTALIDGQPVQLTVMSGLPREDVLRKLKEFSDAVCNSKGQANIAPASPDILEPAE